VIHHVFRGMHHTARHTHRIVQHIGGYYFRNPEKIIDHGSTAVSCGGIAGKVAGKAILTGGYHAGRLTLEHGPTAVKFGGEVAAKSGVMIGKMVWTHGPTVAKHSARFMMKSALKGFKLLSS
jgi:hypothetical protein